jgi:hypothetical protein
MIQKFTSFCRASESGFLDLKHTSNLMILVSLLIPKLAWGASIKTERTSESGR